MRERTNLSRRRLLQLTGGMMVAGSYLTATSCSGEVAMPSAVIKTRSGRIQGTVTGGVHRFLGVPFAESPFGTNRFLPPVPRRPWDDILLANSYGPICPQTGGIQRGLPDEGEDCLNLNIWTPDPSAQGLPVMVWAHGGGQVSGSGANELYDGTHFASQGVVLVTNNRRLGAEGYLYLGEYFGDEYGPGNLGILDQIEVLRWVQENIRQFGGDPDNVTLFGESGGGAATQAVIATPASKGLVHRVIPQSGGHSAHRADTAAAITAHMMNKLGIARGDIDALRQTPWSALVDHYDDLQQLDEGQPQVYLPVISEAMPVHPVDAAREGMGADVDYLIGTCLDEMNLFSAIIPGGLEGTQFDVRARQVLQAAGVEWDSMLATYQQSQPGLSREDAAGRIMGDAWFRLPSIKIADDHASHAGAGTYMYLFTWESQFIGAAHAMDLMVFGNGVPFGMLTGFASHEKTAAFMRSAWVNFATSGNPGVDAFAWPEYDLDTRQTVAINKTPSVLQDPYKRQREQLGKVLSGNWQEMGL